MKYLVYLLICSFGICFSACEFKNSHAEEHLHDHEHKHHKHNHDTEEDENVEGLVVFTHKQAENILDFSVETLTPRTFYQILKTSGQVLSVPGDEVIISATMSGIVSISTPKLVEGIAVKRGQQLFSVSGNDLSENNHLSRLSEAKAILGNAKSEYERASTLVLEKIISLKEYQQIKLAYEQAELNYLTLSSGISGSGKSVISPINGYLKNLLIQSGQYVEIGQALATVTQNKRLVLQADVSQRYMAMIKNVQTASFTTPYDNNVYDLTDLNGKLLSFGKSSDGKSFYTPIIFEFDNRSDIVEGSFVEVYLKSQPVENVLVLPISALIEEQGYFFVFVQNEDDEDLYVKKEVAIGASDGLNRQILRGLKSGEKVVVKGAYALKLASMSGSVSEHSHQH